MSTEKLPAIPEPPSRWALLRDIAVFQAKLLVDGLKDIVLAPLSLAIGVIGILFQPKDPGRQFYELLRAGRGFDRWINLFGAADRPGQRPALEDGGLDSYVARLEQALEDQSTRGGLTAKAKLAVDKALDALQAGKDEPPPPGST